MTELCTLDLLYFDGVENEEGETRPIFIPNACHICKVMRHDSSNTTGTKLLSCSGCRMIAYCGLAHQKEHWKHHKVTLIFFLYYKIHTINCDMNENLRTFFSNITVQDLCKAIQQILKKENRSSLFGEAGKLNLSSESWKAYRYNLMVRVEKCLSVIEFVCLLRYSH